MTEKEMKKLSRAELLELLLIQTKETERLRKKLENAEAALADRQLRMERAGDLAHAVLSINGVMEAAQAAAQQYLDNIIQMEQEVRLRFGNLQQELPPEPAIHQQSAPAAQQSDEELLNQLNDLLGES